MGDAGFLPSFFDIVYYCDATPSVGMGHAKRAVDVINALEARRRDVSVALCGSYTDAAMSFLRRFIGRAVPLFETGSELSCRLAILDTMFDPLRPEYLDAEECRTIKNTCRTLVHINGVLEIDLPDSIDVFINHLPDVRIVGNTRCRKRIGFDYAPVSESFFRAEQSPVPTRLLCIIGGNEVQNGPELLLDALAKLGDRVAPADMIVSPHFPDSARARLRSKRVAVEIHQNVESIMPFLSDASSVVCTYGNATYEALSCHKPTFTVSYKPFQEEYSAYLESKGLILNLGYFADIDMEKLELTASHECRARLQQASRNAFKRSGIEQIADVIEEELDNAQDN